MDKYIKEESGLTVLDGRSELVAATSTHDPRPKRCREVNDEPFSSHTKQLQLDIRSQPRVFTPLTRSLSHIYNRIKNTRCFKPKIRQIKELPNRVYYQFHDIHSHPTDRCYGLKNYIQDLINHGKLGDYVDYPEDLIHHRLLAKRDHSRSPINHRNPIPTLRRTHSPRQQSSPPPTPQHNHNRLPSSHR
ncbi:hypothetical protein IFM89_025644 [Coptis chinensis]|uniref:Uncharacterized protein n=1 Tax=Coptis chinensis TaxID=261450 RepID=A0A835M0R2_9MAGN|nr:hypothetical protein IFM89_025644 [Coptis chinensis]